MFKESVPIIKTITVISLPCKITPIYCGPTAGPTPASDEGTRHVHKNILEDGSFLFHTTQSQNLRPKEKASQCQMGSPEASGTKLKPEGDLMTSPGAAHL